MSSAEDFRYRNAQVFGTGQRHFRRMQETDTITEA